MNSELIAAIIAAVVAVGCAILTAITARSSQRKAHEHECRLEEFRQRLDKDVKRVEAQLGDQSGATGSHLNIEYLGVEAAAAVESVHWAFGCWSMDPPRAPSRTPRAHEERSPGVRVYLGGGGPCSQSSTLKVSSSRAARSCVSGRSTTLDQNRHTLWSQDASLTPGTRLALRPGRTIIPMG